MNRAWAARARPDPYIVAILATVAAASFLPARGGAATALAVATKAAIALLFFLHGAQLSREAILAGLIQWRLHLAILATTFGLFPLLGLLAQDIRVLPPALGAGVLFLCCLPSTLQSSIAFTSIARGNVAAAVCAASASNLLGILATPALATVLMSARGRGVSLASLTGIVFQLLLPFLAGQLLRPLLRVWMDRRRRLLGLVDRGSILLVVYGAFSAAVAAGLWRQVTVGQIGVLVAACGAILVTVLIATRAAARMLGLPRPDEIVVVFCGSKKSLASGVPMAGSLFPGATAGVFLLPLMIYHQMQLMACAVIARRYAGAQKPAPEATGA